MILNENNIQAPFQYKISENTFELLKRNGELELNTDNVQVKVYQGERLFMADIGYSVDGPLEEMEFLIDDIKVYPVILEELEDLQTVELKDNEIYLIKDDLNFKSIIFFPPSDLNKNFKFNITTYSSTISSFMFDEAAKKLNGLDTNYPVKNYYENIDYKINDIIKYNGYLYRVFKEFTSDSTDYYLEKNCNPLTPFKKLELDTDYKANELIEDNNNFLIVQKDFRYENKDGVLTDLTGLLKTLQDIIIWFDGIAKIYKNQIIIKDGFYYTVLEDIENPIWGNIQSKLDYFNKASNSFYDDTNSGFGNDTNTVQKSIEKLKSGKQDSLTAGNNINLNGNNISVIGGTNKEYVTGNNYYIDDLIVKDEKIYKVNEDFISTDWSTDIAKLTLISSGCGGATAAIDVSYDNSKTNLEYISGYDFPKFKTPIPDTINLILTDVNKTTEYPATITKQADGSYLFNSDLSNYSNIQSNGILITIKSIESNSNNYQMYSILSQFFEFINVNEPTFYQCEEGEIIVSSVSEALEFAFAFIKDLGVLFYIVRADKTPIAQNNYNLTLNIKNRVLRNKDTNLFTILGNDNTIVNLSLENDETNIKITGEYTSIRKTITEGFFFYSPIIENYFNLIDLITNLNNTDGIISSTGKAMKFGISKNDTPLSNSTPEYIFYFAYQDGSEIQQGDVFTFNLTPDKNSTLDPVYSPVANVQELGEALAIRYMIAPYYAQYAKEDGTFDENEEPSIWFKKMYNITTTWQIIFNTESVGFRTEGSLANVDRVNGIQGDAIRNMTGYFERGCIAMFNAAAGVFTPVRNSCANARMLAEPEDVSGLYDKIEFNASYAVPTANEVRIKNRLKRVYKLLTINGKKISDIIGA